MKAKVLFVDDDEGNLVVCEAHCGDEFEVLTARDAPAALELLNAEPNVGVIVSDQRMPGTNGIELLERVREEHPDVVRILITAYSDLTAAIDAINRGQVRRYLTKPWHPDALKAELRDALSVYTMSRKLESLGSRLRETERVYALGIIAASVGHELRNPISWLGGSIDLAMQQLEALESTLGGVDVGPDAEKHLGKIRDALGQASSGANRVFDIVRGISMPMSSRPPSSELVDLEEVLQITLELLSCELRGKGRLECDVQARPRIHGNGTKVGQVLLNLLVNATQALDAHPAAENVIRVTLTNDGDRALLLVADNGPGVAEADRERIFEPLFSTKMDGGTGLGLAISRQIAQELGGTLTVSRDAALGGALFSLRLPRYCEEEDSVPVAANC